MSTHLLSISSTEDLEAKSFIVFCLFLSRLGGELTSIKGAEEGRFVRALVTSNEICSLDLIQWNSRGFWLIFLVLREELVSRFHSAGLEAAWLH